MGYCGSLNAAAEKNEDGRGLACEVSEGNKDFLRALQESLTF